MHRTTINVLIVLTIVCMLAVGIGMWNLAQTRLDRFIAPDATNIEIQSFGLGEQRISYRSPRSDYRWFFTIKRNLAMEGWSAPVANRWGLHSGLETHWRISPFLFVYIKEQVSLQGDPDFAQITIRREVIIPWRRLFESPIR